MSRSVQAPFDAIVTLQRLAPTRDKALKNVAALNRFLEQCLQNMADQIEQADEEEGEERGMSQRRMPAWERAIGEPSTWDNDSDATRLGASSASATGDQWVICVRQIFNICMPHIEVAQVRGHHRQGQLCPRTCEGWGRGGPSDSMVWIGGPCHKVALMPMEPQPCYRGGLVCYRH